MAERTIATVLKTVEPHGSGGSNPPLSANVKSQDIGNPRTCAFGVSSRFVAGLVAVCGVEVVVAEGLPVVLSTTRMSRLVKIMVTGVPLSGRPRLM